MKAFTIYDSKAETYSYPFPHLNAATALREFSEKVNTPGNQFSSHPYDFALFEIGEWDDDVGVFMQYEVKKNLGLAGDYKAKEV